MNIIDGIADDASELGTDNDIDDSTTTDTDIVQASKGAAAVAARIVIPCYFWYDDMMPPSY